MRVLLAHDGSADADAALKDLHKAGLHDVHLLVLSVDERWVPTVDLLEEPDVADGGAAVAVQRRAAPGDAPTSIEALAVARRAAAWVNEHFPHWRVEVEGVAGAPIEVIIERAETWSADLVIVGPHGRAAAPVMVPGSVTLAVLKYVPRCARVARATAGRATPRIIVATDGSPGSNATLHQIRARAWPAGAQVQVLSVVDTRPARQDGPPLCEQSACEQRARRAGKGAVSSIRDAGLLAFFSLGRGDPAEVIVETARDWEADCVFVGARGTSRLAKHHLGSVSTAVAMTAHCSVEVVRAPLNPMGECHENVGVDC